MLHQCSHIGCIGSRYETVNILTVKSKQIPKTNDIFDNDCVDDTIYVYLKVSSVFKLLYKIIKQIVKWEYVLFLYVLLKWSGSESCNINL